MRLVIGSRGSDLALAQSRQIQAQLRELPGHPDVEIEIIKTSGDLIQNVPLSELAGTPEERKGFFTKEIEEALIRGDVDLAVHSYKDLPTANPPGLVIGAMPRRVVAHDVLVFRREARRSDRPPYLAAGARVGTSAVRRSTQLAFRFPGLVPETIRGNVPTRLRKLRDGDFDAVILASAGIERLRAAGVFDEGENAGLLEGLEFVPLEPPDFIPAPAQGALALQCRSDDRRMIELLARLHDHEAGALVDAERAVLAALEGGCHLPLGASCRREDRRFHMHVFLGAEAEDNRRGRPFAFQRFDTDPARLARRVVDELCEELPIVLTGRPDRMREIVVELGVSAGNAAAPVAAQRLIELPLIEIERLPIGGDQRDAYRAWFERQKAESVPPLIAVFSAPGAESFAAFVAGEGLELPRELRWAVNGERTATKLRECFPGADVAFQSRDGTGASLASQLLQAGIRNALAVSAERSRPEFADVLRQAGGEVQRMPLYRTRSAPPTAEKLTALPADAFVLFGSPSGVETFFDALAAAGLDDRDFRYCALGPTTARSIEERGRVPYALAERTDYTDFVRDLA